MGKDGSKWPNLVRGGGRKSLFFKLKKTCFPTFCNFLSTFFQQRVTLKTWYPSWRCQYKKFWILAIFWYAHCTQAWSRGGKMTNIRIPNYPFSLHLLLVSRLRTEQKWQQKFSIDQRSSNCSKSAQNTDRTGPMSWIK